MTTPTLPIQDILFSHINCVGLCFASLSSLPIQKIHGSVCNWRSYETW
jgi:hypothetical protein